MDMDAKGLGKALFITCSSLGIAFAVGYPFHISILKFPFRGSHIYSAVFWFVLFVAMVGIRVGWQRERRPRFWKPLLRGMMAGYFSSLVGYIALVSSSGRLENLIKKPNNVLYALMFITIIFGWLLGAIAGVFEHLGDRYFQRAR